MKEQKDKAKPEKIKSDKTKAEKSKKKSLKAKKAKKTSPPATIDVLRECVPTFGILADENRLAILKILFDTKRMNVNELTSKLHLSRPAVSHHLRLMRDAGLVQVEQVGKERYYTPSFEQAGDRFARLMTALVAEGFIAADCLPKS